MARISEPTAKEEAEWKEWVASRPAAVRAIAERFDPWTLYRMKSSGFRPDRRAIRAEYRGAARSHPPGPVRDGRRRDRQAQVASEAVAALER
jgi:hypothetical protein